MILHELQLRQGTFSVAWPNFVDWRDQNHSFEAMAAYTQDHFDLSGIQPPKLVRGARVSAAFFPLLGVQPSLGRGFTEADDKPGAVLAVVLSHHVWRDYFGADPAMIGKPVNLSSSLYTVV